MFLLDSGLSKAPPTQNSSSLHNIIILMSRNKIIMIGYYCTLDKQALENWDAEETSWSWWIGKNIHDDEWFRIEI